jgi:hypothetical protein
MRLRSWLGSLKKGNRKCGIDGGVGGCFSPWYGSEKALTSCPCGHDYGRAVARKYIIKDRAS